MNHENLIAGGEWPVAVDLEFLATFSVAAALAGRPQDEYGILSTLALPLVRPPHVDMSALGTADGSWDSTGRWRRSIHAPVTNGTRIYAHAKQREVVEGFRDAYHQGLSRGTECSVSYLCDKFLEFPEARTRVALRSTSQYKTLLNYVHSEPLVLSREGRRTRKLYKRAAGGIGAVVGNIGPRKVARIAKAEVDSLIAGDVPLFQVGPLGRTLLDAQERVQASFPRDYGVDLVLNRASRLSHRDRDIQLRSITAALERSGSFENIRQVRDDSADQ